MFRNIRKNKFSKILASYLAIQLITTAVVPTFSYALTSGPSQPEFNSFTPIGTSDMVNLASGDFNYNIPIMDVGGYPLNLAYDSGITMDQEASWVGLGWNLNVGQINRQVRGIPDDFDGDELVYETNIKPNKTVGMTMRANPQVFGLGDVGGELNVGLNIQYNNYEGISFAPTYGLSFKLSDNITTGMNVTTSATEGVSISPTINLEAKLAKGDKSSINGITGGLGLGIGLNSRQGLSSFNMSTSLSQQFKGDKQYKIGELTDSFTTTNSTAGSGSISFANNTFSPVKRNAYTNTNFTFSASIGLDFWGIDAEVGLDAFGANQRLKFQGEPIPEKSFGYEFSHHATQADILDFNKEKDQIVSENTLVLPVTNYTYDLYSINGQGTGGMFRPYRGQVGFMFDQFIQDEGLGGSLGGEFTAATGFHLGVDLKESQSESHTGIWNTNATSFFNQANPLNNELDYEEVYYKTIGEFRVDDESDILDSSLGGEAAITIDLNDAPGSPGRYGLNKFIKKEYGADDAVVYSDIAIEGKIKRDHRERRNRTVTKFTNKEASSLSSTLIEPSSAGENWHTAGMHILQPDGATYVYGETAYNKEKHEVTFALDGTGDCTEGIISYSANVDNTSSNSRGLDNYFNRITTPAYAHTYLLTAVLSSDYEDLTGDGLTDDDLGAYTKFNYTVKNENFEWRIPFAQNKASYNEGLRTNTLDQKGNYVYGKKELKYIESIETKTHIAIFDLSERKDGYGVDGKNGGADINSSNKTYYLNTISLYSKPEYEALGDDASPIKVAHFEYDYSLCPGVPNNLGEATSDIDNDHFSGNNASGKLTLRQVYFTYRDSNMGKYTPYTFNYSDFNPSYNLKGYDIWGNYKENVGSCTNGGTDVPAPEFPFVDQWDRPMQDMYASAWSLQNIDLPSGGKLNVTYESDDYQFVQNKRAMQMFKIAGVTKEDLIPNSNDLVANSDDQDQAFLYNPDNFSQDARYLIVEVPEEETSAISFRNKYIGDESDPIYFRFLTQMVAGQSQSYDYVSGYFEIDQSAPIENRYYIFTNAGKHYGAIRMSFSDMEGGINGNKNVNPISKAAWYFARRNLNRQSYGLDLNPGNENVGDIAQSLVSSFGAIAEIFTGPNQKLRNLQCGLRFNPHKSWIRLQHGGDQKIGGGVRVKKIELDDRWDTMLGVTTTPANDKYYNASYGQEYNYNLPDGRSSGVATFEPNGSKENPFVEPFYNNGERLVAPREVSYVEKPFGESFFPAPTVTYRQVTVKNLERTDEELSLERHATGKVVSTFYTSFDFPTKTDYTQLNQGGFYTNENQIGASLLQGLLNLNIETNTEMALTQGFVIQTNDMNGKERSQNVYSETDAFISGVDYNYYQTDTGDVESKVPVIYSNGEVRTDKSIGTHYDVITDFRENYSKSETFGINTNFATFLIPLPPFVITVPTPIPDYAKHERTLHTTTTTKVIHKSGILKEKIASDLGATVSTQNLAWDAASGQTLLTKTINEYNDHYYNFTFPAHWYYEGMDKASNNIGVEGNLLFSNSDTDAPNRHVFTLDGSTYSGTMQADDIFSLGDELITYDTDAEGAEISNTADRLWVVDIIGNTLTLMDREGNVINQSCSNVTKLNDLKFRIIRSGYRNQHTASMSSVTSQINPIDINNDGTLNPITNASFRYNFLSTDNDYSLNPKVVNASAVRYKEHWKPQLESGLPQLPTSLEAFFNSDSLLIAGISPELYGFNPYVYNVRGDWRAVNSYAYLTGRNNISVEQTRVSPRDQGFFTDFSSFYTLDIDNTNWLIDQSKWTFASAVSLYSPYGVELENKDALDRYSSAQYGYEYTLPTAVASNSKYGEMGFEGFEDYKSTAFGTLIKSGHFNVANALPSSTLEDKVAHSGKYSLIVQSDSPVAYTQSLSNPDYEVTQPECPDDPPPPGDQVEATVDNPPGCNSNIDSATVTFTGEQGDQIPFTFTYTEDLAPSNSVCDRNIQINGVNYQGSSGSGMIEITAANGVKVFNITATLTGGVFFSSGPNPQDDIKYAITFVINENEESGINTNFIVNLNEFCDQVGPCN